MMGSSRATSVTTGARFGTTMEGRSKTSGRRAQRVPAQMYATRTRRPPVHTHTRARALSHKMWAAFRILVSTGTHLHMRWCVFGVGAVTRHATHTCSLHHRCWTRAWALACACAGHVRQHELRAGTSERNGRIRQRGVLWWVERVPVRHLSNRGCVSTGPSKLIQRLSGSGRGCELLLGRARTNYGGGSLWEGVLV